MFALIGAIIGLLTSGIPELLKYLKARSDQKHEEKMLRLEIDHAQVMQKMEVDKEQYIADINADIAESQALKDRTTFQASGNKWIDAFLALYNGTVRPTIAYAITGFYGYIKWASYQLALKVMDPHQAIVALWTETDAGIFSTVIFYFFGQRSWRYVFGKLGK